MTPIQCKLYNVKIPVRDLKESVTFYKSVLLFLGFSDGRQYNDPIDLKPTVVFGNGRVYLEIVEEPSLVPKYDLTSIAGPRIEFQASSKADVDRFYEHLKRCDAKVLCEPMYLFEELLGSRETDPWYATYFADPGGTKFGFVYTVR